MKLSREEEDWIEEVILSNLIHSTNTLRAAAIGSVYSVKKAQAKYIKFLLSTVPKLKLEGMRLVVDCGWGAASQLISRIYKKLGADVIAINDKPRGSRINIGGAIQPSYLRQVVLKEKADIGIALDGDGDRCIFIDEQGNILDGDYIMAIVGNHFIRQGKLINNTLVTTVMSNLGLKISLEENGGKLVTTGVGDKYVLEELKKHNLNLGGEQSGHIIFLNHLPSPDGLLTSLQVLKVMRETGSSLGKLAETMAKLPQVLVNVAVKEKRDFSDMPSVCGQLDNFNNQLKGLGRILLRYSGTERLARIMVEGKNQKLINKIANTLAETIRKEIGEEVSNAEHISL